MKNGRVALVTGAGSRGGIGFAVARLLYEEGYRLLITSTTSRIEERARELDPSGGSVASLVGDLTDEDVSARLVALARERFGGLDALVHNAGMTSLSDPVTASGSFEDIDAESWRKGLARNLDAAFYVARAAMGALTRSPSARVVFVSSVTGPVMAMRHEPIYAAAKAGLVGLTRALALDAAAHGVSVNAVAPGWIATESQTPHEAVQGRLSPLGRSGTAEEVAALIGFLVSPQAAYITGQCVVIDGGNSIAEERALPEL